MECIVLSIVESNVDIFMVLLCIYSKYNYLFVIF